MLNTLLTSPVLILVVGLAARALLLAAVLLAIGIPVLAAVYGWQGVVWMAGRVTGLHRDGELRWSDDCFYAPTHQWLRKVEAGILRMGFDDLAQRVLPDLTGLQVATVGTRVEAGRPMGVLYCGNVLVPLLAPVSGVIQAVNGRVLDRPDLLHQDPYRTAWVADVRPTGESYTHWPSAEKAHRWLTEESRRLTHLMEHEWGIAAADGGELLSEAHAELTPEQLDRVRRALLGLAS